MQFEPMEEMTEVIEANQPQDAATPAKAKKSSRRSEGQVIERGPDKFLLRIFMGKDSTGRKHYFKQLLKAADLPENFSPYSARHTVATTMADEGVHPKAAAARLGHANIKTTLDIYTRSTATMDDAASDALSRAISGRK